MSLCNFMPHHHVPTAGPTPVGMAKADFLANLQPYISAEDTARIRALPDTTVFWPSSIGDVVESTADTVSVTMTMHFTFDS